MISSLHRISTRLPLIFLFLSLASLSLFYQPFGLTSAALAPPPLPPPTSFLSKPMDSSASSKAAAAFQHLLNLERDLKTLSPEERVRYVLKTTQSTAGYSQDVWRRVELVQADEGVATFRLKITQADCNYIGVVHGSLLSLLVDNCSTTMLYSLDNYFLSGGVSTDLHVTFVEGARVGDTILITSSSMRQGSRLAQTYTEIKLEKPHSPASVDVSSNGFKNPYKSNKQSKHQLGLVAYAIHTKIDVKLPPQVRQMQEKMMQKQQQRQSKL